MITTQTACTTILPDKLSDLNAYAQILAQRLGHLHAELLVEKMCTVESKHKIFMHDLLQVLAEPAETEIVDPCTHFTPVVARMSLEVGRYYVKISGVECPVNWFCRPAAVDGWASYVGPGGQTYSIRNHTAWRRGGWVP